MAFAAPKYLITDLGTEFTGRKSKNPAVRIRTKQRFVSAENVCATARLECYWRTLKHDASRAFVSGVHSPRRTWKERSNRLSPTTWPSGRINDSWARHQPSPSQGWSQHP